MEEEAKLRYLFKKIQHVALQKTVEALKVQQRTNPVGMTYTIAANHLATAVSELPEHVNRTRTVSAVGGEKATIYNSDGSIKTGEIDGWANIPYSDKQKVWNERRKLGIRFRPKNKNKKYVRGDETDANTANQIKQLTEQNKLYKRKIKSLNKVSFDKSANKNDQDGEEIDAGDQFGGKASKKNKKSKDNE